MQPLMQARNQPAARQGTLRRRSPKLKVSERLASSPVPPFDGLELLPSSSLLLPDEVTSSLGSREAMISRYNTIKN